MIKWNWLPLWLMEPLILSKPYAQSIPIIPDVYKRQALYAEKVRINPGNYVDAARTFKKLEYTDEEYAQEIHVVVYSVISGKFLRSSADITAISLALER